MSVDPVDDTLKFDADTFEPRQGETFSIRPGSSPEKTVLLRLKEVVRYPDRVVAEGFPQPYSLLFEAVGESRLESGQICAVYDGEKLWMNLHISPVSIPDKGRSEIFYEAVFS